MTIGEVIGRIKIHDSLDVERIMGIMNKSAYGRGKKEADWAADLWEAIGTIFENEQGDHGEDGDGEYGDYDEDKIDIYRRLQAYESIFNLDVKQKLAAQLELPEKICIASDTSIFHPIDSTTTKWQKKSRTIVYSQQKINGQVARDDFITTSHNQFVVKGYEFLGVKVEVAP